MKLDQNSINGLVAPFVGVWIEILKIHNVDHSEIVAPFVGVWIEILPDFYVRLSLLCRSLRGSVD